MDRLLNEDIRRRLGIEAVLGEADKKKKSGRRNRGNATERFVRREFEEEVHGRRPRGRLRKRWRENTIRIFACYYSKQCISNL